MQSRFRFAFRFLRGALVLAGLVFVFAAAAQFTGLPWRAYAALSRIPAPGHEPPTHVLVMGGSGIPGESGLMRTFYAAQAARLHPGAQVLVALPQAAAESDASRAYRDELRLRGVAARRIRILADGRNTREQALRLAEFLADATNAARILVVSCPEHVRRTAAAVRKACADAGREIELSALPAFPISLEDPSPWRAAELDAPAHPVAAAVPDAGNWLHLRYNLWANLGYTIGALREAAALAYYRLRGWI